MRSWIAASRLARLCTVAVMVLTTEGLLTPVMAQSTPTGAQGNSAASQSTSATATPTATATIAAAPAAQPGGGSKGGGSAPPAPTVTSPTAPVFTNTTNFSIAGTAQAASLVQVYLDANRNGRIDKAEATPVGSQQLAAGAGAFSVGVPLTSNAASAFLVTASAAKQESKPTAVPLITQDSTPPSVSVTAPTASAITSSRTLTATASDNPGGSGVASVQFQLSSDGGASWTNVANPLTTAPYTTTLPTSQADGSYQVRAQAVDKASNLASSSPVSLTLDTTAPTVSITAPTAGAVTSSKTLSAAASDGTGSGIASVQFQTSADNGASWTNAGSALTSAPYSTTVSTLTDGSYQVRAIATDRAGNSTSSAALSFTLDSTAPAAPVVTDPAAPTTVSATSYTIKGTAAANSLVRIWVDANGNGQKDPGEPLAGSQQLSGGATTFSISVNLTTNTANAFVVTATDLAGNESAAVAAPKITQDSTGLTISAVAITPPAFSPNEDGVKDTAGIGYTLSAAATVTVRIYDSASTPNLVRTLVNAQPRSAGANSELWDGKRDGGQVAADATYTVRIDATDSLGTAAPQATATVVLDTTPPDTTITTQPVSSTSSTDASFSFTSSEPNTAFQCALDSNSATDCSTGSASYTGLATGSHTFSVRATDAAGNTDPTPALFSWTISVGTPPPAPAR